MEISIVIPAWNEASVIKENLDSLNKLDYPKDQCEVILIAGGVDQTYRIAVNYTPYMRSFAGYKVLEQKQGGKNQAILQGLSASQGEIIVLLDADTIVAKKWLYHMTLPIKKVKNRVTISNPYAIKDSWVSRFYMINKEYYLDKLTHFGGGGGIAFLNDFSYEMQSHIFDPGYKIGLDYLAVERLIEMGREVCFCKEAIIHTHFPSSLKYFIKGELRWTTAYLIIKGVSYQAFFKLLLLLLTLFFCFIPFNVSVWIVSMIVHLVYMIKRIKMLVAVKLKFENKNSSDYFFYIILSYLYLGINFLSHIRYLLGLSDNVSLSQGSREL